MESHEAADTDRCACGESRPCVSRGATVFLGFTNPMHISPSFPRTKIHAWIAALFLVSLISPGASVLAGDALTGTTANAVGNGLLGSLFKRKTTVVDGTSGTRVSGMDRVNRSILGLPLGILRGVGKGVSRMAGKAVTDHITHN